MTPYLSLRSDILFRCIAAGEFLNPIDPGIESRFSSPENIFSKTHTLYTIPRLFIQPIKFALAKWILTVLVFLLFSSSFL